MMKKAFFAATASLIPMLLLAEAPSQASPTTQPQASPQTHPQMLDREAIPSSEMNQHTLYGLRLGLTGASYRYEEPGVMESKADLMGIQAQYAYHYENDYSLKLQYSYEWGKANYSSSATGQMDDLPVYTYDLRLLIGQDMKMASELFVPYIGLGYRHLYNDARGITTTGHYGYRRYNTLIYMPMGIDSYAEIAGYKIVSNAEIDLLLKGYQRSCFQDVSTSLSQLNNKQRAGVGLRLSVLVEMEKFSFGPFYRYWSIDDSDSISYAGQYYLEPENKTTEIGLEFNYNI